ncbi:hypothetical protein [Sphingobium lignivorans]|uniref:Uncharacterized protein n=1 Tax=Sphingobium lignivorans TaxID=2735886 RepID=A0ABR6NFA6_9SPHN|nr:hypothetical protein [Sphingobium lignivorans]MBB5985968.1 hypothetical protein [Sphingobium lignivorans]
MTTPSPAEIAARLSEAQKNAIFYLGGHHHKSTIRSLREKGLYERGLLTELGKAVRAIIEKEGK